MTYESFRPSEVQVGDEIESYDDFWSIKFVIDKIESAPHCDGGVRWRTWRFHGVLDGIRRCVQVSTWVRWDMVGPREGVRWTPGPNHGRV